MQAKFFCPICKNDILDFEQSCCVNNPENFPILVHNFDKLEEELEVLRKSKEDWYAATHLEYLKGPFRHPILKRIQYLKDLLLRLNLPKTSAFLDIGCGDGFNLTWLKDHFTNIYSSDYNFLRMLRAKNLKIAKISLADIMNYPAYDESFDVVFFHHVLEHIPDDARAMKEIYRILKKGGICILGIPNEGAFWWKLAYKLEPKIKLRSDHVHFYTLKSAIRLCVSQNFKVIETKRIGYGIPHWTLDTILRSNKWIHDLLDGMGRIFFPSQSTSLYLVLKK